MMSSRFKKTAAAIAMSTMVIAPIATAGLVLTSEAAFAKSEKNKGKSKSKSSASSAGHSSSGMYASQLKNLNAVNSWLMGQGYMNASTNSNFGLIKTYQVALSSLYSAAGFAAEYGVDDRTIAEAYVANCNADKPPLDFDCDLETKIAAEEYLAALIAVAPEGFSGPELDYFNAALGF